MIPQLFNGMITILLTKLMLNDLPHASGLITYGEERLIEGRIDIAQEREIRQRKEKLGCNVLMRLIRESPEKDHISVYLFYLSVFGNVRSESTLMFMNSNDAHIYTAERFGVSVDEVKRRIIIGRSYIESKWRSSRPRGSYRGKYEYRFGPAISIIYSCIDKLLLEFVGN